MKRGFKGRRKGKGKGGKVSSGRGFFKKRKGRSNLADDCTDAWQAEGQWHASQWQDASWDEWSWDYSEESYEAKGKGKKGKKGKGEGKYGKDGKEGKVRLQGRSSATCRCCPDRYSGDYCHNVLR